MENTETHVRATLHNLCWQLGIQIQPTEYTNVLRDMGVDSLDLMELVITTEQQFNITITNHEVDTLGTFNDLVQLVTKKINH